jgi:hypothetical protein
VSTLLSTPGQDDIGDMVGSNVLVNILKPVNIVNLGNTLRRGVVWGRGSLSCRTYEFFSG